MITVRAHHLLCMPRFYRGGYDETFADNMKKLCMEIRNNPDVEIKVVVGEPDNLCKKCPHLDKEECIQSAKIGKWVVDQDKRVLDYLGLKKDSVHVAKDVFNLGLEKVNADTIRDVCQGCVFLDNCVKVGVNKSFARALE